MLAEPRLPVLPIDDASLINWLDHVVIPALVSEFLRTPSARPSEVVSLQEAA